MALVIRYFSTTSAGAADGTTWANRAALLTAGVTDTIITGFNFSGSDSLEVRIGPGTYTMTTGLAAGSFANAPTAANPIYFHGCDSSGNLLTPSDPDWTSDLPAWDDSTLPVIVTTTNIQTLTGSASSWYLRLIKFTASGRSGNLFTTIANADWVVSTNSTSNSSATAGGAARMTNCVFSCTGTSYSGTLLQSAGEVDNCRVVGNSSASSGNRDGIANSSTNGFTSTTRCTVINHPGRGYFNSGGATGVMGTITSCVFSGMGGDAIQLPNTAAQTSFFKVTRCAITGNTGSGINAQTNAHVFVSDCRLRDNAGGNFTSFTNNPTDFNNVTSAGSDAADYVNVGAGNYQAKAGGPVALVGAGVSIQGGATGGSYCFGG